MWLFVGLGNPGNEYEGTRHNIGFLAVDTLHLQGQGVPYRAKSGAAVAEGSIGPRSGVQRAVFCKPMEFMNLSGQSAARVATFWKIPIDQTIVIHDDLDLPFGRMRLAKGGGHGGHNGLKSLFAHIGQDFLRIRMGIGRPAAGHDPANYVLARFSKLEQKHLPLILGEAAGAAQSIVEGGITTAMNEWNGRKAIDLSS